LPPVESCNTLDSSDEPAAAAKLSAILEDSFEEYWDQHRQILSRKPTYDNFLEMFGLHDVYNSRRNPPCQASDGARTISKRYNEQRDRGYQAIFDSLPPNYLEEIFNSNQDESSSDKSCFLEKVSRVQETLFPRTTSQAQTPIQGRVQRRVYNKPLPAPKFEEPFDTAVFEALVGKNYQPGYPSYYYEQSTSAAAKLRDEIQAELANQGRPKQRVFQKIIPRPEHGQHYGTVVFEAEGTKIQSPQSNYSEQAPTFDNSMDEFLHYERLAQGSDNNAELANQRRSD
ncbi:CLUMA_CG004158, isoform A, partial [Clunio marinus]